MSWIYNNKKLEDSDIPEKSVGFVYTIENKTTGKRYIGRKILTSIKRKPPKKDQTRRKKVITESNWREYFGSSEEMKELVKVYGKDDFVRTILHFCFSKSEMAFLEAKEIFLRDALIKNEYLNKWITIRINSKNLHNLFY